MKIEAMNAIVFLPLFFTITIQSSTKPLNSVKQSFSNETVEIPLQQYYQVTLPLPTDNLTPSCTISSLNHTFAHSLPVNVTYIPPPATCQWSIAVLDFRVECKGEEHDGIAGIWIGGVELLRTSTARPTEDGVFWNVRKDVSRYSSILAQQNLNLSVVLGNLVNENLTGVYNVNISFLFYSEVAVAGSFPMALPAGESEARSSNRKLFSVKNYEVDDNLTLNRVIKSFYPYDTPADLIIPVSGVFDDGFWFKIQNEADVKTTNVQISPKTYKAVLELYVSCHGDDEFWYMNPPDSYIKANDLPVTNSKGPYREVLVTIDGKLAGTVIPFPVIYPGGINPLFWKPVVSIGAFDFPSYDIDLTSYLGLLLDNRFHSIGFQVVDGSSFWLVDANLHIWLDRANVQAIVEFEPPSMEIEQEYEFKGLDGEFETELERTTSATRLVQSSYGIIKTEVTEEIKFKNKLKFKDNGVSGIRKELDQTIKTKTKIKVTNRGHSIGETEIEKSYPLKISIETGRGSCIGSFRVNTTVIQGRSETFSDEAASISRALNHDVNCTGWMMVNGNSVISGSMENHQTYCYKNDDSGCCSRNVGVVEGDIVADETTSICVY